MENSVHELVIIGSGPAGLTAAIYAARANINPVVIAGITPGGQLMGTTEVENYPGFIDGILGPVLMQNMTKQAEKFGAKLVYQNATTVDFSKDTKTIVTTDGEYKAKSIIIAVGSSPRTLGLEAEKKFWGRGVSTCATCDGAFYKEKIVAVIGGGDSACEEANFLTKFASKVYMIHRRDELRASKIMADRVLNNKKIEILWDTEVRDILGNEKVEKLKLFENVKNEEKELKVDGMFLAIGHIPNTDFLKGQVELDDAGYVKVVEGKTHTSSKGVFVAGDVYDHVYQQAITSAGMGCMAALDAEKYLLNSN